MYLPLSYGRAPEVPRFDDRLLKILTQKVLRLAEDRCRSCYRSSEAEQEQQTVIAIIA